METVIVSKFGEYTFATHERIKRAAEIIKSNPSRRYIMAVAPGRRTPDDIKITDLLFVAQARSVNGENFVEILAQIQDRFTQIIQGLEIDFDLESEIADLKKNLFFRKNLYYIASRGEHIMAKIFAKFLGWEFIDSTKLIFFDKNGGFNVEKSLSIASGFLKNVKRAVIPGYYGSIGGTNVKTFAREDCDTSAAIIAIAVKANTLERWTEPKSIFVVDPSIIDNPLTIRNMTYSELVGLTYMGLEVVNDLALFHLYKSGIPMSIRMIDNVDDPGVLVTNELPQEISRKLVACMAGRKGYRALHIEKFGINKEVGFMQKLFNVFVKRNISCEHCISGIRRVSLLIKNPIFDLRRKDVLDEVKKAVEPDNMAVSENIALIALIGQGINKSRGIFAKIFDSLAKAEIEIHVIDQSDDNHSIILGVYDQDYERATQVLYNDIILGGGE